MRHADHTADEPLTDSLVDRLAALDDCLHGVDPDTTRLSAGTHAAAGLTHPELGDAVDAILMLRQAAAASRRPAGDDEPPLPPRIGRFTVVRVAGSGGFARVAEAIDPTLNRRVALKVPRPEAILAPTLRRRFLREAEIAARLSHPNIVTIHEVGEADGLAYIAEEFCGRGSLAEWLEQHPGPLPPRAAVQLVLALARAIAYAHDEGVIHRDIKPANVLLMPARQNDPADLPPDLIVKLGDFGLGKASTPDDDASQLTRTGARVGTPTWMAPEQVDATIGPVGPWSDVHALGLLLDRLLTGRCLRGGRTDAETFRQILLDDPVPCDRVRPGIPRDLGAVCLKCLARHPRDRYASAGDLASDLQRYFNGHPTIARPLSPAARLARTVRRRPLATTLAGLAVAALGIAGWAAVERVRERARHAATSADMRRHEATASLRRGFDAFRTGNAAAALGQLDACRRIEPELADSFAGRWLGRRLEGEQERLLPTAGDTATPLHDVAVSADGSMFAAGAADGRLFIGWLGTSSTDAIARPVIAVKAHDEINGVVFSPDGAHVATVGEDGRLRLWNTADGTAADEAPTVPGALYGVAFGADGSSIAYGGADRVLRIARLDEHGRIAPEPRSVRMPDRYQGEIESLCAIDAERLAMAIGPTVLVVDGRQGDVLRALTTHKEIIARLAISADRRLLSVVGHDRSPTVVRTTDGSMMRLIERHPSWVDGCGFSPDGLRLVTAGKDGVARVFNVATGILEQRFIGHVGRIWDAVFDASGSVITAGADGTLRRWHTDARPELAGLTEISLTAVRAKCATFLEDPGDRESLLVGHESLTSTPDGRDAIASAMSCVDVATGSTHTLPPALAGSCQVLVADGRRDRIIAMAEDAPVIAFSRTTFHDLGSLTIANEPAVSGDSGAILPDGSVVVGCRGGRLILWNPDTSSAAVIARFDRNVDCVAVTSGPPPRLAAGSRRHVAIHELVPATRAGLLSDARVVCRLPDLPGDVHTIAWSMDGRRLVCGMNEGLVMVFDAATGTALGSLAAHERDLIGAVYLADGRTLVTADTDNVRISDAATLATLDEIRPGWRIHDLCASADGSTVAFVGGVHQPPNDAADPSARIGLIVVKPRRAGASR
jgi:WD40 repeat protein